MKMKIMKRLSALSEKEILALAISNEEEDSKIYSTLSYIFLNENPAVSEMFKCMSKEEQDHKSQLIDLYKSRYGNEIPYITRRDIAGFAKLAPIWLKENVTVQEAKEYARMMEYNAWQFYTNCAKMVTDINVRKMLGDLALTEQEHQAKAIHYELNLSASAKRKAFLLSVIQPGLSGLVDGSISTLAPVFAAAFATHNSSSAFLVGIAASVGGGISMGITEGISDDGVLTGRGHPWLRGGVCAAMTLIGGLGHTLPYIIEDFNIATSVAFFTVCIELICISWIRWKYMESSFWLCILQILVGGILVVLSGIGIGMS